MPMATQKHGKIGLCETCEAIYKFKSNETKVATVKINLIKSIEV